MEQTQTPNTNDPRKLLKNPDVSETTYHAPSVHVGADHNPNRGISSATTEKPFDEFTDVRSYGNIQESASHTTTDPRHFWEDNFSNTTNNISHNPVIAGHDPSNDIVTAAASRHFDEVFNADGVGNWQILSSSAPRFDLYRNGSISSIASEVVENAGSGWYHEYFPFAPFSGPLVGFEEDMDAPGEYEYEYALISPPQIASGSFNHSSQISTIIPASSSIPEEIQSYVDVIKSFRTNKDGLPRRGNLAKNERLRGQIRRE